MDTFKSVSFNPLVGRRERIVEIMKDIPVLCVPAPPVSFSIHCNSPRCCLSFER